MIILLIFALIGMVTVGMLVYFWFQAPAPTPPAPRRSLDRPPPSPRPPLPLVLTSQESETQAVRDHRELAKQYREMIDELYDFGEHVAGRREDES